MRWDGVNMNYFADVDTDPCVALLGELLPTQTGTTADIEDKAGFVRKIQELNTGIQYFSAKKSFSQHEHEHKKHKHTYTFI